MSLSDWTKLQIETTKRQSRGDQQHLASLLNGLDKTLDALRRADRALCESYELLHRISGVQSPS